MTIASSKAPSQGDFLRTVHELLLSDEFFDEIFRELGIPYEPVRWRPTIRARSSTRAPA